MNGQKEKISLTEMIRNLPEHEPPKELTALVIGELAPKHISLWRRLCLIAKKPQVITLTPLRMVSTMAAIVVLFAVVIQFPSEHIDNAVLQNNYKLIPVTFNLDATEARSVNLIGSFNGWKPEGYSMRKDSQNNKWIIEISIPPGGHEYAFLINNNKSIPDPKATFYKNDGFNSRNSVLYVSSEDESVL